MILHGLAAIKKGYRDEKEEMSKKNIEVSVLDAEGRYKALSEDVIGEHLVGLT